MNYLHAKQSLSEILTGSVFTCLPEVETFAKRNLPTSLNITNSAPIRQSDKTISKRSNFYFFIYRKSKKEEKFTSGLAEGLVEEALRPETMQPWDGAMKSLRSPIRSVAENFSDIASKPKIETAALFGEPRI